MWRSMRGRSVEEYEGEERVEEYEGEEKGKGV